MVAHLPSKSVWLQISSQGGGFVAASTSPGALLVVSGTRGTALARVERVIVTVVRMLKSFMMIARRLDV